MSSVDFVEPGMDDASAKSAQDAPVPSPRKRNKSDAARTTWRKADSVADIKSSYVHSTNQLVSSEKRKLKRTNSSVAEVAQAGSSEPSTPEKRPTKFMSLRHTGKVGDVPVVPLASIDLLYDSNRIVPVPGFHLESLLDVPDTRLLSDGDGRDPAKHQMEFTQWVGHNFCEKSDHVLHYVALDGGPNELLVITTCEEHDSSDKNVKCINAIVSTIDKDEKVCIPASQLQPTKVSLTSKGTLTKSGKATTVEKKLMSYIRPEAAKRKLRRGRSNPELMDGLMTLMRLRLGYLHADRKFKVGVLFWNGQIVDEDVLADSEGSPEFDEFLEFLGEKVKLKDWPKFAGGLDVHRNMDGKHSIYTEWKDSEVMFHVSTMLAGTAQQKKIHIGNDPVVIVFSNTDKPFSPDYVKSKFHQIYIVVSVEKDEATIRRVMQSPRRKRQVTSSPASNSPQLAIPTSPSKDKRLSLRLNKISVKSLLDREASEARASDSPRRSDGSLTARDETGTSPPPEERNRMTRSASNVSPPSAEELLSPPTSIRIKKRVSSNIFESRAVSAALDAAAAEEREKSSKKRKKKHAKSPEESPPSTSSVYYRISILRRDGVPLFPPTVDTPTPVFKRGKKFRDFLFCKITNGIIAAYQSPGFRDRIQLNRRAFLENLKRTVLESSSGNL